MRISDWSSDVCSSDLDTAQVEDRRRRLRTALAGFDSATIATTHQFCQLVLRSLGVAGDRDAGVSLVDDLDDLITEVVDDLYLDRDRKSVVSGNSVSVRVDNGGRLIIKKKKINT